MPNAASISAVAIIPHSESVGMFVTTGAGGGVGGAPKLMFKIPSTLTLGLTVLERLILVIVSSDVTPTKLLNALDTATDVEPMSASPAPKTCTVI